MLVTAVALAFADVSIVALAIPDLYIEFGSTIPAVSWVLTGYALAVAVAGLVWLVLLRRISGATLALAGAAVFAASSLAAGFAPSLAALIAARVVQGVGGAALVAGSLGVLVTLLGDSRRAARWWAAAGVAGAALGPVLGGAVTQLARLAGGVHHPGADRADGGGRHGDRYAAARPPFTSSTIAGPVVRWSPTPRSRSRSAPSSASSSSACSSSSWCGAFPRSSAPSW